MSIFNFQNDLSDSVPAWENIIGSFNEYVDDDEIWELAKESSSMPNFSDIYQDILIRKVIDCFMEATGLAEWEFEHEYDINCYCSSVMIDGVFVEDEDTFWELVEKLKQ